MRPIKTLLLRVMAIVVALSFGLQAQEVKQGGYRTAQLKVTAGGSGWDFDTGNLIQLVLTDAKGNAESSGEYLTVGNDSPMPIKVSSKRVGIQNVEIGPGERRRFKIQGYRRPNSQYSEFNSSVPVGIVYWSGPSPQETQQAVQAKAQKEADSKAGQERKAQEAQRTREAEERAKKDEWTRNAQNQQDDQAARARAAAEESRRQWELSQQRAKAQRDGIAALGQMINKTLADKAIREQQERIRTNLKALESGTLNRCDSCGGTGYSECNRCSGEGVEECSLCSGRGEVGFGQFANKCTMCGGGGKSSCSTCKGTGRVDCDDCAGQGSKGSLKGAPHGSAPNIVSSPKAAMEAVERGNSKFGRGDFDGAVFDYSEAIRLDPRSVSGWSNRGGAKAKKGDFDGAIADSSEAIRLDPRTVFSWSNRASAKIDKGDLDGAIHDSSEAIRLDPQMAGAWSNRGHAKYKKGDVEGAIADCSEAIRLDPQNTTAWYIRGDAKANKGDIKGGIADCSEAIRLEERNAYAWNIRGAIKANNGDLEGGIADFSEAIRLDPRFIWAWSARGKAKRKKGDIEGAIADHSEAIRLDPRNTDAWHNRGAAKADKGDFEGAIADRSIAFEIHRDGWTAAAIAATYWRSGDLQRGLDWARKSTALDPNNQYAALYEFILSSRINKGIRSKDREVLAMRLRNADTKWPSRLLEYFAYPGKSPLAPPTTKGEMPDYYFYLGQEALIAGDRAKAVSLFKQAAEGPFGDTSTALAKAELRRLK